MVRICRDQVLYVSRRPTEQTAWGYEQFPKLSRAQDGTIRLHISTNLDLWKAECAMGGPLVFRSIDAGHTFEHDDSGVPQANFQPVGSAMYAFAKRKGCSSLGLPVLNRVSYGYNGRTLFTLHPFSSLPHEEQSILLLRFSNGQEQAIHGRLTGVETACAMESEWVYSASENGNVPIQTLLPFDFSLANSVPVVFAPDGWIAALFEPCLNSSDYLRGRMNIIRSRDEGRSWQSIAVIEPDASLPFGFMPECALNETSGGRLVLMVRTRGNHDMKYPHYLAHYTSDDRGASWLQHPPATDCSVTPQLLAGRSGLVLLYGRPGIYWRSSADGVHWSESHTLLGPDEASLPVPMPMSMWNEIHHQYSCCNLSVLEVETGRYLLAYSDFLHPMDDGYHKAIHVAELEID